MACATVTHFLTSSHISSQELAALKGSMYGSRIIGSTMLGSKLVPGLGAAPGSHQRLPGKRKVIVVVHSMRYCND